MGKEYKKREGDFPSHSTLAFRASFDSAKQIHRSSRACDGKVIVRIDILQGSDIQLFFIGNFSKTAADFYGAGFIEKHPSLFIAVGAAHKFILLAPNSEVFIITADKARFYCSAAA